MTICRRRVDQTNTPKDNAKGLTVGRVIDILEAVASASGPISPTEIAEQLSIPRASAHRLCASLEEQGMLQTSLNGRGLHASKRLHNLAMGVISAAPFQAQRRAILTALSRSIGETCNIAIPDGVEMIYFDRAETHWPVRINLQVGSRVPTYATAGGKMYLSMLDKTRQERVLKNIKLKRHTANTLVSIKALKADLDAISRRGYSLDNEEYLDGMVALAVPVQDSRGRLFATLSFHAPCMRIPFSSVLDFLPRLKDASKQLGSLCDH